MYRIPTDNLVELRKRLDKLNKTAVKLGCDPIYMTIVEHELWENPDTYEMLEFDHVVVTGSAPRLPGWEFLATVETFEDANILKIVPGVELTPEQQSRYRTSGSWCEHCQINRYRTKTYLVHNLDTDITYQVGSSCLKDFLGHQNPHQIASFAEMLSAFDEWMRASEGNSEYGEPIGYSLEEFLVRTALCVRKFGWVSRRMEQDSNGERYATASLVWDSFVDRKFWDYNDRKDWEPTGEDFDTAENALEWVGADEFDTSNDYTWNLKVACGREIVDYRTKGIAASLISAYYKHIEKELYKQNQKLESKWIGEPGKRLTLELTLVSQRTIEGNYGYRPTYTYLYRFVTDDGAIVVWFASNPQNLELDDKVTLTGTVKKHDEYEGVKQTIMTRCKIAVPVTTIDPEGDSF